MVTSSSEASALLALSDHLTDAVEQAGRVVVAINARQRMASSGVHWQPGVIVTANHTLKRDEEITATLPDGRTVPVTLAGRDPGTDLAVLRLPDSDLPAAQLADAAGLKVGQMALAIARSAEGSPGASWGVVSALGSAWRTWRGGQIDRFIRADLTLYPGFSGGPLVDVSGQVVGINTSALSRSMGLTIPAVTVSRVANQLLSTGRVARGYLGVGMQPVRLPDSLRQALALPGNGGVIIITIEPGSPADKAGLFIGDVLVALDNTAVGDTAEVLAMLGAERIGQPLQARIIRGGKLIDATITVGERPRREA